MLAHAYRLSKGLPLYQEPSVEFIPYIYPPGYPVVPQQLSVLMPLDYALGRGVSTLSIAGAAVALMAFVVRYRAQWMGGCLQGPSVARCLCSVTQTRGHF